MSEKVEIHAIKDRDLRNVLGHFGLSERIDKGELMCESCSQTLTWDNLGALLIREGSLLAFCSLPACIDVVATKGV